MTPKPHLLLALLLIFLSACGGPGSDVASQQPPMVAGVQSDQAGKITSNAGPDLTVLPGSFVVLDGSASSLNGSGELTYKWRLESRPPSSSAQITERGVGNGISLLIFCGIVASFPAAIGQAFEAAGAKDHDCPPKRRHWEI